MNFRFIPVFALAFLITFQPVLIVFAEDEVTYNSASISEMNSAPSMGLYDNLENQIRNDENMAVSSPIINEPPTESAPAEEITENENNGGGGWNDEENEPPAEEVPIGDGPEALLGGDSGTSKIIETVSAGTKVLPKTDPSTGALVYSYNFTLPPGRNNLTPGLSLNYNSGLKNNDSIVGYNWQFDIPSITRQNKYGSENIYEHNDFSSSLTGELTQITSSSSYVSKVDNGEFLTYTYSGNYWIVYDKQGTKYTFASSTSARQSDPGDSSRVYQWMLEEIRDTNDNYIKYEYTKDGGQIYPSKITYTGNGTTDGIFEVNFNLESHDTSPTMYHPDFAVKNNYRVADITIEENNSWIRKYEFDYTTGDAGYRNLLSTITESGRDSLGATTTLNPTEFTYKDREPIGFAEGVTSSWALPKEYVDGPHENGPTLIQLRDVDGNSYVDVVWSDSQTPVYDSRKVWLNNGDGTWDGPLHYYWNIPIPIRGYTYHADLGTRVVDYNGDLLPDIVNSFTENRGKNVDYSVIYKNSGVSSTSWIITTSSVPIGFVFGEDSNSDNATGIYDINGDGLNDILYSFHPYMGSIEEDVFINNGGTGWSSATSSEWVVPSELLNQNDDFEMFSYNQWVDYNLDGLLDESQHSGGSGGEVFINNGHTWLPNSTTTWALVLPFLYTDDVEYYGNTDAGTRASDLNGDGMTDFLMITNNDYDGLNIFLSLATGRETGVSFTPDTEIELEVGETSLPYFSRNGSTSYTGFADINGDGMEDILESYIRWTPDPYDEYQTELFSASYLNLGTPFTDLLSGIETPDGATSSISYKVSSKYYDENNDLLNPELPIIVTTVSSIETNDGFGVTSSDSFIYSDGDYYFGGSYDRKFAGFGLVTETDSVGNVTKTYYHQGNDTETSLGEYSDHSSKIGKPYRMEEYDNGGNLYRLTINKWENSSIATSSDFVKLTRETVLDYDGDADHKDTGVEYSYDAKGNISTVTNWGEVTASTDGSYSDTGSDKSVETITYASSTTARIYSTPSNRTLVDQSSNKVRESKYFYDNQSSGVVTKGNLTKEQKWRSGSNYATYEKTYSGTYGTLLTETDPNSNVTTYVYDTYNLHVATSTNALSQSKTFTYDYSSGKPTEIKDQNGFKYQTTYDGLDRVTEEKIPDPTTTPGSPVTKTTYSYNDTVFPHSVTSTEYLDSSTSRVSVSYRDGFGRNIQNRKEMEGTNLYSVKDTIYDSRGLLYKGSLPYQATGPTYSSATTTASLFTTYTYDSLDRPLTIVTNIATTSNAYDQWVTTTTDPGSKIKDYENDARGNLVEVGEHVATSTYSTTYEWNLNGMLTKITDALGNVRNFTYNGVGSRTASEDLHAVSDGTFGSWAYQYDSAGNLATSGSPVGDIVVYTYDALNRVTKENWTSGSGTEITYTYDSCTAGVGYLCSAIVTGSATTSYTYSPVGKIKDETVAVSGTSTSFVTTSGYDRQGNISQIILPDNSRIRYNYNASGLTESVERKQGSTWYDVLTDIDYAPTDQITYLAYANGVSTTNTFDPTKLYRLTNKTTGKAGTTFQDIDYTYDAVGNITDIVDAGGTGGGKTLAMTYDYLHRLSTLSASSMATGSSSYTQNFFYNEIGNIVKVTGTGGTTYSSTQYNGSSTTSSYANPHAATKIGGVNRSYDRNGNMTGNGTLTNTWNYKNQLTQSVNGSVTSTFIYDTSGTRLSLATSSGQLITPNANYEVQGTSKRRMIYLGDQLIASIEDNNGTINPNYVHTDHLNGSSVITNASSTQIELTDYYAFGEQRVDLTTTSFKEKRKYTGHMHDDDTGLEYVKARYLNSAYNRFISQDGVFQAIGDENKIIELGGKDLSVFLKDPQSLNSYSYARNNPYKYTDPTGNVIETAVDIASVIFDAHSLRQSIRDGNIKGAAGNSGMLVLDLASTAVPGVPAIGSIRMAGNVADGLKTAEKIGDVAGIDKGGVYALTDKTTGEVVRTGRTNDLTRRSFEHAKNPNTSGFDFNIVHRTNDYSTQRGLEQILHDINTPVLNKINPISPNNPNLKKYLDAAKDFLKKSNNKNLK